CMLAPMSASSSAGHDPLHISVNGDARSVPAATTVAALIATMGIDPTRVAVERNHDVVPRKTWAEVLLAEGDRLEIVAFIGGGAADANHEDDDPLIIAGRRFQSRLLVGTGKYSSIEIGREAI